MALLFVGPALWVNIKPKSVQRSATVLTLVLVPIVAYGSYIALGAPHLLGQYYSPAAQTKRANELKLRPYYARFVREIVKNQLNLPYDEANTELIINFASMYFAQEGAVLSLEVKKLLENVLAHNPKRVAILNILAIHAYKTKSFAQAVHYWQQILELVPESLRGSESEKILKNKIIATQKQIALNLKVDGPTKK